MAVALTSTALTTLTTLKAILGITGTTENDNLTRAINVASQRIATYCNRNFAYQTVSAEKHSGRDSIYLWVDVAPLLSVSSLTENDVALSSDSYAISDSAAGEISRVDGGLFGWAGQGWVAIRSDPVWSESSYDYYEVTYVGGYVLPKDAVAASLSSDAETFDMSGGKTLVLVTDEGTTSIAFVDGNFSVPAAATATEVNTVVAAALGDDMSSAVSSGVLTITRSADYVDNTLQASGTAATALGLDTDEQAGTRTLPFDLEQACISLAIYQYRQRRSTGQAISNEKLLSYSVSYSTGNSNGADSSMQEAARLGIPAEIAASLSPYRRYH